MDKREQTLRQLRADFETQWQVEFPSAPPPPIRALSSLRFSEDAVQGSSRGGVPFDDWLDSGAVEQLTNSLRITEEKISQLSDQLARKTYLRDYLFQLLHCLDESAAAAVRGEVQRSRPLPVNNFVPSALDSNVTVPSLSQEGSRAKHEVSTGTQGGCEGQNSVLKLDSIKGLGKTKPGSDSSCEKPSTFTEPGTEKEEEEQTTVSSTISGQLRANRHKEEEQTTIFRGRVVGPLTDLAAGETSSVGSKSAGTDGECISGSTRRLCPQLSGPCHNNTAGRLTVTQAQPGDGSEGRDRCVAVSVSQQPPLQGYSNTRCNVTTTSQTAAGKVRDGKNTSTSTNYSVLCGSSKKPAPLPPNRGELYDTWERRRCGLKGTGTTVSRDSAAGSKDNRSIVITDTRSTATTTHGPPKTVSTHFSTLPSEKGAHRWKTGPSRSSADTQPPLFRSTQSHGSLRHQSRSPSAHQSRAVTTSCNKTGDGSFPPVTNIATQTDITFSLNDGCSDAGHPHSCAQSTMQFWNRKKSGAKRPEESRDRDNSGVLGRYSPVDFPLATPPPSGRRIESLPNRNVQYLQLTDGFNIVLGSDPVPTPGRSPQLPPKHGTRHHQEEAVREGNDYENSGDEEVYDNNTQPRATSREGTPTLLSSHEKSAGDWQVTEDSGRRRGSEDANLGTRDRVRNITPPPHPSGSPSSHMTTAHHHLSSFGGHVPVSRASSDSAAVAAGPGSGARQGPDTSPNLGSKPQPQPRRKILPSLPTDKQKPSSVFYVTTRPQQQDDVTTPPQQQDDVTTPPPPQQTPIPRAQQMNSEATGWGKMSAVGDTRAKGEEDQVTEATTTTAAAATECDMKGEGREEERRQRGIGDGLSAVERDGRAPDRKDRDTGAPPRHLHRDDTAWVQLEGEARNLTSDFPATEVFFQREGTVTQTATPAWHANRTGANGSEQESSRAINVISVAKGDTSSVAHSAVASLVQSTAEGSGEEANQQRSDSVEEGAKLSASTDSQDVVGQLCRASVSGAVRINQCLSHAGGGGGVTTGYGDDNAAATTNMLRFHRHTLTSDNQQENRGDRSPAVYRKMEETSGRHEEPADASAAPFPRGGDERREDGGKKAEEEEEEAVTPTAPYPEHHELDRSEVAEADLTPQPVYHETDLDAVLRPKNPPPTPPKPPKKAKVNTYENWTINRAVTQLVDTDSDDDDSDISTEDSTLHRASSASTSKDSGLCLDVHGNSNLTSPSSVSSEVVADASVVAVAVGGGGSEMGQKSELDTCRISSLEELARLQEDDADYVNISFTNDNLDCRDQEDNVSIVSDFLYIPGSEVAHGNQTPSSVSDDEDHDSPPSVDSSYDDADGRDTPSSGSARDTMLRMRYLVVTGILKTELSYLAILELLLHYKRTLEASCKTSRPVISEDDILSIFGNLQQLHVIHKEFVNGLQHKVEHWSPEQTIGDVFKCLVLMFPEFSKYAENYHNAVATIHRCSQESQTFQDLAQQIVLTSTTREVTSLEDALFKPVQRLQRNTLVLYDLIKHTPQDHPDHETLQKALNLSQHNLENFGTNLVPGQRVEEKRHLVKSSFLVELVNGCRKLRFIFLFSDILVCTKREQHRSGRVSFDCKWFIPMNVLKLDTKFSYQDDMKFSKKDEIDELKRKLRSLKTEIKNEMKKEETKDKHWSITGMSSSRTIEKLKKKIDELQPQLILASPKLPFKVTHDSGKTHTLIMTTDYEREEWREVITSLRRKSVRGLEAVPPSALEVQEMINSVKELPQVNRIGTVLTDRDEEVIYGTLNVTIHKLNGLKTACDTYCCLEMDSYGHFFMKARTHICGNSADPSWNEDFELELEGSQTLRILCYRGGPDKQGDVLLGRGALEMSKEWLKGTFQETTIAMNEYSLVLSVRYTKAEKTMQRTPSKQNSAVFGARISQCAKREGKTVPTIVTTCVQEVEKRGLDETGIYRVSGVTSDVQKLKKHFDKNAKTAAVIVGDVDIHSVTGVLKLYFRELPEPLFTEDSYSLFVDALKLTDVEGKEKCMLSLLHKLPDINYYTAVYLLEHLLKVSRSEKENKMSIHNLSTIFGPTLLAPATKSAPASMSEMMSLGAEQCMKQSAVIFYFLSLLARGVSLRRSSTQS